MIAYMDKTVGRLIEGLNELWLRENTLVLFYSDNGTHLNVSSVLNGKQVQGGKATPRQTGIRVPLIANWPGMIESSRTSDDLVDASDFFPTLADLAQAKIADKSQIDGLSFVPTLFDQPGKKRNGVSSGTILGPVGTRIVFQDMFSPSIMSTNYFRTEGSLIFAERNAGDRTRRHASREESFASQRKAQSSNSENDERTGLQIRFEGRRCLR